MTANEFQKFFNALPGAMDKVKGQLRTQSAFSLACRVPLGYLRGIAKGSHDLSEAHLSRMLPIMITYGYKG